MLGTSISIVYLTYINKQRISSFNSYKMARTNRKASIRKKTIVGEGGIVSKVINKAIDLLPFEVHLPGYKYCGPGTRLQERLIRGDRGINPLDEACKFHDIAYSNYSDSINRRKADIELADSAWQRFKSKDSKLGEKAAAILVTTAMKAKTKVGGGKKRKVNKKGQKKGGIIPLLPIFAGLSALGSLVGGAASIVKTINKNQISKKELSELERHNRAMEGKGKGLYLKPYKGKGKKKVAKKKRLSR